MRKEENMFASEVIYLSDMPDDATNTFYMP